MTTFALLLLGLVALICGAELVVRGGTRLAIRLRIPPIVVGLTIVSIGTSAPELAIGIEAALRGNGSLAVGNIAGTNTVNLLLIFGLSALLRPITLDSQTLRFNLPVMIVAALALVAMAMDGALTRTDGAVMVGAGVLYTLALIVLTRHESPATKLGFEQEFAGRAHVRPLVDVAWSSMALLAGIVIIVIGSDLLVEQAVSLARAMNVSDALIGLTIIAIGTSLPELVTTIVGTLRNNRDIAIGNLLGSSIFNILFILGITCLVPDQAMPVEADLVRIDIPVMALATLTCIPVFLSGRRVSRIEGALFVSVYALYLLYLLVERT
jgi:cation:H+ antiporter